MIVRLAADKNIRFARGLKGAVPRAPTDLLKALEMSSSDEIEDRIRGYACPDGRPWTALGTTAFTGCLPAISTTGSRLVLDFSAFDHSRALLKHRRSSLSDAVLGALTVDEGVDGLLSAPLHPAVFFDAPVGTVCQTATAPSKLAVWFSDTEDHRGRIGLVEGCETDTSSHLNEHAKPQYGYFSHERPLEVALMRIYHKQSYIFYTTRTIYNCR